MNNFHLVMAGFVVLAAVLGFFAVRAESRKGKKSAGDAPGKVSKPVADISALQLREMLQASPAPVAVVFWRPGCPGCDTMKPLFQAAADAHKGSVRFVTINVLDNRTTARRLDIKRIPTLMVFQGSDETPLNSRIGSLDPEGIEKFINDAVSSQKG